MSPAEDAETGGILRTTSPSRAGRSAKAVALRVGLAGDGPQAGQNGITAPRPLSQSVTQRMVIEKAMLEGVNNTPGHGNAPLFVGDELRNLIDYVYKLAHP